MRHVGRILRPGFVVGSSEIQEDAPFALYRIAQECLQNVVKHAAARTVRVESVWSCSSRR